MRKQTFGALIVAAGIALLGGCAGTGPSSAARPLPPAKALQPADLASLAGEWGGTLQGVSGQLAGRRTTLVRVTVAPDGSFTSNINGMPGAGRGKIEDGKVVFEGSATRGVATYHEGDGRKVLVGEGTWLGVDGRSAFELTKR
jgi:hypothetical protein